MQTSTEALRNRWNTIAKTYSFIGKTLLTPALTLARMLKIEEAKSIFEAGCGNGELTLHLLQTLPSDVKYISTDLSDNMIESAKKRKEELKDKLNVTNHEFRVVDAQDLSGFEDESFDVYVGNLFFNLVPDEHKTLEEAKRVLKKGGKIGISVLGKRENCTFFTLWQDIIKKYEKPDDTPVRSSFHLGDKEKLVNLFKEHGFEVEF